MRENDTSAKLDEVLTKPLQDQASEIVELYARILDVYTVTESRYRGTVECGKSVNGFAASGNCR